MNKEQQKQLITEIMDLDAKDGLYEDEVDKLAHQYNPVMKLDAEFIRAGFKAGYNKAKSTLYTEEQVENILIEYVKTNPTKPYSVIKWFRKYIQSLKQPKKD
jgi:arginyl-tRNA synthetase